VPRRVTALQNEDEVAKPRWPGANNYDLTARYFRALSDPLRLTILEILLDGEKSVEQIRAALGVKQPRLSNQLACLRWCDFVTTRREGTRIFYSISEPTIRDVLRLADKALTNQAERIAACTRIGA
jgi:DNA-binding transcriptional ArsR family regulator